MFSFVWPPCVKHIVFVWNWLTLKMGKQDKVNNVSRVEGCGDIQRCWDRANVSRWKCSFDRGNNFIGDHDDLRWTKSSLKKFFVLKVWGFVIFFLVQNCRSCQSGTLNVFFSSKGMYLRNKVSFSLEWQSFKLVSKVRVDTVSVGNCYDSVDNRWWWVWGRFWTDGRRYDRRW